MKQKNHTEYMRAYRAANRERLRARERAHYAANREKIAERKKAWRQANPDRMQARERRARDNKKAWRIKNIEKVRERARWRHKARKYSMSPEEFEQMLARQRGACAICSRPLDAAARGRRAPAKPVVDHDHETGEVRGILCGTCNSGIGHLKDSSALLRLAIAYLERPR